MRMEKRTHVSENRVSAAVWINMDGQFYLLIGWCLLQEQYMAGDLITEGSTVLWGPWGMLGLWLSGGRVSDNSIFSSQDVYSSIFMSFFFKYLSTAQCGCSDILNVIRMLIYLEVFILSVWPLPPKWSEIAPFSFWSLKVGVPSSVSGSIVQH